MTCEWVLIVSAVSKRQASDSRMRAPKDVRDGAAVGTRLACFAATAQAGCEWPVRACLKRADNSTGFASLPTLGSTAHRWEWSEVSCSDPLLPDLFKRA